MAVRGDQTSQGERVSPALADDGDPARATVNWLSFFQMPILTEAVITNTGRAEGLALGPWEELEGNQ